MTAKDRNILTDEQALALTQVWSLLHKAFPNMLDVDIIQRYMLRYPLAAVGASVVCYGGDPKTGERVVLLIDRKEIKADGQHYLGLLGGYVELGGVRNVKDASKDVTRCEQPDEGVIAEAAEESKDANNRSLVNLTPDRLELSFVGINEQTNPKVIYTSYIAELMGSEILAIREHISALKADIAYRSLTLQYNDHEIFGMHLTNIQDARVHRADEFRYHSTWLSLQKALDKIDGPLRHDSYIKPAPPDARL